MTKPRKKKVQRKTGRPLEDIPMRKLIQRVRDEMDEKLRMSFSGGEDKRKKE